MEQARSALAALAIATGDGSKASSNQAPQSPPELDIGFPLRGEEMERLQKALARSEHPYILEKLIENSLPMDSISALPIFTTIAETGTVIAWQTKPAGSAGKVLVILFTTPTEEGELSFVLFDPFYPVKVPPYALSATKPKPLGRLPRILIVDDDPVALMILQYYLAIYGRVDTAMQGREAIEKFQSALANDPYDALFLDIMMPEMDGHQTLKTIRSAEDKAGILIGDGCRVAMVSALSDFATISTSFQDQCDVYLVKPFERDAIQNVMVKFGLKPMDINAKQVPL